MRLSNILDENTVLHDLKATTKVEAITELLGLIKKRYPQLDYERINKSILAREDVESTNFGRSIAFPHARTDAVEEMYIAVGISATGIIEKTPDGKPLHMICLMLTPSNIARHYLQTLAAFSTFARQEANIPKIIKAKSPAAVIDTIWESGVTIEKELTARDLMRHDVVTVTEDNSLRDVANRMFTNRLSALAVVDDNGCLLGQITDKELIQAALPDFKSLISNLNYSLDIEPFEELLKKEDKIKVRQLYLKDIEIVATDTRIVEVAAMMLFKDLRRVFVVSENRLIGILLRKDIVHMIIRG